MGANAIIPASGAPLQFPSPTQVSTSSRVLCVVNSVLRSQKCKIGMVVGLGDLTYSRVTTRVGVSNTHVLGI